MGGHEVHVRLCRMFRSADQVSLVLAVGIIDHEDEVPLLQLGDRFLYGVEFHVVVPSDCDAVSCSEAMLLKECHRDAPLFP